MVHIEFTDWNGRKCTADLTNDFHEIFVKYLKTHGSVITRQAFIEDLPQEDESDGN